MHLYSTRRIRWWLEMENSSLIGRHHGNIQKWKKLPQIKYGVEEGTVADGGNDAQKLVIYTT